MNPLLDISDINQLTSYEFESVCRGFSSFARLEGRTGLTRVLTKYKIFVDINDISLVPHLVMDGFWETPVTQCLARLVRPGDTCIDVGAHLGYFSVLMSALAGGSGKTLAIEPNPRIASLLKRTSEINHPGFRVWEGALSNLSGRTEIHIPRLHTGDSSLLVRKEAGEEGFIREEVAVDTLDRLLPAFGLSRVDVMKIDAEGAEPLIFKGMPETLSANPDLKIVMEFSPGLYHDAREFSRILSERFDAYTIESGFRFVPFHITEFLESNEAGTHTDLLLLAKGAQVPDD